MSGQRVPQKGDVRTVDVPGSQFSGAGGQVDRASPVANPSELAPRAGKQAQGVMAASDALGGILAEVQSGLKANAAEQMATLESSVAAKQIIRDEQMQTNERIKGELLPIFAKRKAIADRMLEINSMDPISKAVAGIFHKNYSESYLTKEDNLLAHQEDVISDEFDKTNTIQRALLDTMNQTYTDKSSLQALAAKNMAMTLGMAQDSLTIAQAQMGATTDIIRTNGAAAAAIEGQRADVLSQITDTQTVSTLLAQAKSTGKPVMVGGVEVSEGDLVNRGMQIENIGLQMQQLRINIAQGDQQLIEITQKRIVDSMTPRERSKLAENNGVMADGTQISTEVLTPALARDAQIAESVTQSAITQQIGGATKATVQQWSGEFALVRGRANGLFGSRATAGLSRAVVQQSQSIEQGVAQLNRMPDGPAKDAMKARLGQQAAGFIESNRKEVDKLVTSATSDKEVQTLYRSFLTGQPLAPDQAARGFINAVRGGAPLPGMSADDMSNPAISAMTAAVNRVYAQNGGQAGVQARLGNKTTAAQMQLQLTQAVTKAAKSGWVNGIAQKVFGSIPSWAAADKHPAAGISAGKIAAAQAQGDKAGLEAAASVSQREIGVAVTPAQVSALTAGQQVQGIDLTPDQRANLTKALKTLQTQEMMKALDAGWSAGTGPRPSVTLADYMASPGFMKRIESLDDNVGNTSLGALVASSIAGKGSLTSSLTSYARNFAAGAEQNEQIQQQQTREQYRSYRNDPFKRSAAILGSIEGLDETSEERVLEFIRSRSPKPKSSILAGLSNANASGLGGDTLSEVAPNIDNLIMNQKWPDDLEPLRKKIAPLWVQHGRIVDNAVRGMEKN